MANLLDRSSLVLTPTAYNNGEALCIKPDDGSGDFDFSRNSAATRVNAQGLVENVQILSSNLVQNGDFSEEGAEEVSNGSFSQEGVELVTNGSFDSDSGWNKQTSNWTISNGYAVCDGLQTTNSSLFQDLAVVNGNSYRIDFTITDSANDLNLILGATTIGQYGAGTHSIYITKDANASARIFFQATASNGFQGSIDNVSCVEVGQDWTFGTGWSVGEDKAISDTTASNLTPSTVLVSGKTYKFTLDVAKISVGSFTFLLRFNGSNTVIGTINSEGSFTFYAKADATGFRLQNLSGGTTDFSVTNISVKEVGQNWTSEQGIWTFGDGVANGNGASGAAEELSQNISAGGIVAGDKVKLSFEIKNYVSGSVQVIGITPAPGNSGNGIYEYIGEVTSVNFRMRGSSFNGSITNISLIEITTDTNLPRINYEGFSYQDALGSELSSPLDFLNKWFGAGATSITNNSFEVNGSGQGMYFALGIDKEYKIKVSNVVGDVNVRYRNGLSGAGTVVGNFDEFIIINTFGSTNPNIYLRANSATSITVGDVSVKEYLGQEVVPDSGCGSWLWEPQSTNLFLKSEPTSAEGLSIGVSYESFDWGIGFNNCVRYPNNSTLYLHYGGTCLASTSYTISYYIKMDNGEQPIYGTDFTHRIGNTLGTSPILTNMGNGVYRVSETKISSTSNLTRNGVIKDTNFSVNGFRITALQLEQQSYATSYIPTEGATVTRNQDVCTNGGSLASINSTEGVLYAEIAALANDGTVRFLGLNDGSNNNRVVILYDSSANRIRAIVSSGGTKYVDVNYQLTNILDFHKVAIKYKLNDFALWIDGVERATDTSGSAPIGLNDLEFDLNSGGPFFGKTKALAVFPYLSDSELQSLTTI